MNPMPKNAMMRIAALLAQTGIAFETYKDQVIFEKNEVVKDDGLPYKVYTPYSRKWLARFEEKDYPTILQKITSMLLPKNNQNVA